MPLLFLHIPKTAGTSLRMAMERVLAPVERAYIYPRGELAGAITPDLLATLPDRDKLRLVMGHFHFGLHEKVAGRYVTMLREPVARLGSLYSFYARVRPDLVGEAAIAEWVASGKTLQTDNEMVRLISGRAKVPFGKVSDDLLADALDKLDRHFAVLLVKDMERSTEILSGLLGRPIPAVTRENASTETAVIDDPVRQELAHLNRFDVALYEYGAQRFAESLLRDGLAG